MAVKQDRKDKEMKKMILGTFIGAFRKLGQWAVEVCLSRIRVKNRYRVP